MTGATIPTALDIRDRCQSEGNLLLVNPNNVEDHQATIVSLPPQHQHFEDYQDSKLLYRVVKPTMLLFNILYLFVKIGFYHLRIFFLFQAVCQFKL